MARNTPTQDRRQDERTPSPAFDWPEHTNTEPRQDTDTTAGTAARPAIVETDIAIFGDLRSLREPGWQVAQEIRLQAAAGYRTALVHTPTEDDHTWRFINPEIQLCVSEGLARPVDPRTALVQTELLIIRQPHGVLHALDARSAPPIPRIFARTILAVADAATIRSDPATLRDKDQLFRNLFGGEARWTAAPGADWEALTQSGGRLQHDDEPWVTAISTEVGGPHRPTGGRPIFGRVCFADASDWPEDEATLFTTYPADRRLRLLCSPKAEGLPFRPPAEWEIFRPGEIGWRRFLGSLDVLLYYPSSSPIEIPVTAISWAMEHGITVVLPPALEALIGPGPVYTAPQNAVAAAESVLPDRRRHLARFRLRPSAGANAHRRRLERLVEKPPVQQQTAIRLARPWAPRVLFISTDGHGLGHLARTLAIARRLPARLQPVFATESPAAAMVGQCGFPCEYISSQPDRRGSWNGWLRRNLESLMAFYGARCIVFDGNRPEAGIIDAVTGHPAYNLIWIRRAMWRIGHTGEPALGRQKFFDLVIEPGEIAGELDDGPTGDYRRDALSVPPVRFLDEDELLPRDAAAQQLGLDPARPALLIQLGSGVNRDILALIERIHAETSRHPDLQLILQEWATAPIALDLWPATKRLRGFPVSRFFRAFDFTISAAGYNTFNEIMSFGLPAILSPNTHRAMDNQEGRAEYGVRQGAALLWSEDEPAAIGKMIDVLMDSNLRQLMAANAGRIARGNGAVRAARAISELAH